MASITMFSEAPRRGRPKRQSVRSALATWLGAAAIGWGLIGAAILEIAGH
jgi:hypothetical protein